MAALPTSNIACRPLSSFISNDQLAVSTILSYHAEYMRLLGECLTTLGPGGVAALTTALPAGVGGVTHSQFSTDRTLPQRFPRVARDLLAEAVAAVEALP